MSSKRTLSCLGLCILCSACVRNHYEVVLKPEGEQLHRGLTCWRQDSSSPGSTRAPDADALKRLGKMYGQSPQSQDGSKHSVGMSFAGNTPRDIGGSGSFNRYSNSMGVLSVYVERFRGQDDLHARVAEIETASDRLTDLLIAWLRIEIEDADSFEKAREFCDTRVRGDLKNLGLYMFAMRLSHRDEQSASLEAFVRMGQYLVERGYFSPTDVPELFRAMSGNGREAGETLLKHVGHALARAMGWDGTGPMPDALAFLSDFDRCRTSFSANLQTTPEYAEMVHEHKDAIEQGGPQPDPYDIISEHFWRIGGLNIFDEPDQLAVKLAAPVHPFMTNGAWEESSKTVAWSGDITSRSPENAAPEPQKTFTYPEVCFAFWSEPNAEYQTRHFGKPCLDGERLGKYCMWYAGLTREEAKQWDEFVDGIDPNAYPAAAVMKFRFTSEPADGPGLASTISRLIVEGLAEASKRDAAGGDATAK